MMSESKQPEYVNEKINISMENLMAGYSCSEAVLLTYSPQFNLQRKTAFKIASGFGGGMGWMGETCGAVIAAYMVIGLKYGAASVKDSYSRQLTHESIARFADIFKERNGSTLCKDLIGKIDLSSIEGRKQIRQKGEVPIIVRDAIIIMEKIFTENS